jgi:WD40 repeat protein
VTSIGLYVMSETCQQVVDSGAIYSIALSPDGVDLLAGGDGGLSLHDASNGDLIQRFDMTGGRLSVAYSPDGHYVAARDYDQGVMVFDRDSSSPLARLESARSAANIAFTLDSNALLVVDDSDRKKVSRWSFLTGEVVPLGYGFNGEVLFLSLSADGRVLVASDDASRNLAFGMPDGKPYAHIDFPGSGGGSMTAAAFSLVGGLHVLCGYERGGVGLGEFVEQSHGPPKPQFTHTLPHSAEVVGERVYDVAFSPNADLFAVRYHSRVELWQRSSGSPPSLVETYEGMGSTDVVARKTLMFAADGKSMITAGYQGIYRCVIAS